MFEVGQEIVTIMEAYPINLRSNDLIDKFTLFKGTRAVVKRIEVNERQHATVILVECSGRPDLINVAYWGAAFKPYFSANKIWKDLNK